MPPKKRASVLHPPTPFNWFSSVFDRSPRPDVDGTHVPGPPLTAIPESAATSSFVLPTVAPLSTVPSIAGSPAPSPARSIKVLPIEDQTDLTTGTPSLIAESRSPQAGQIDFNVPQHVIAPGTFLHEQARSTAPRTWSPPPESTPEVDLDVSDGGGDNHQPVLEGYMRKRRDLLDILKELHSTGIQNELDLPQIVVVGSQSVGKSSLIESMSGLSLPRDSGTCTRCPMECRLQYASTWSCKIVLRFHFDSAGRTLSDLREVDFGPTLYNKKEVEKMLRRAQRAILRPGVPPYKFLDDSDEDVPGYEALTFSANCVCVRVAGPNVPDLYFYDLPGIIANVGDGGNEADIKLVQDLAKSYIKRANCIVLLVISCETDFENQGAGRLVLKDHPLRQRTIGVLTKVDRIEPGATAKWLRILRNQENILQNGWFCVKQPDPLQLAAEISWEDARVAEREFFETNPPWSTLDSRHRGRLGSGGLAESLGSKLSDLASRELPRIQAKVQQYMAQVTRELDAIAPPNIVDPRKQIITLLRDFTKTLARHIEGLPPDITISDPDDTVQTGLVHGLHLTFERFRGKVHQTAPQFRPWSSKQKVNVKMRRALLASAAEDDNAVGLGTVNRLHLDEVLDLAKRSRTRELPGNFPFSVKERLIIQSVKQWQDLSGDCFGEVEDLVSNHVNRLIESHFEKYEHGGLKDAVLKVARAQICESAKATGDKLDGLCLSEMSPYTQNEHYFFDYRRKLVQRYKLIYKQSLGQHGLVAALQRHIGPDPPSDPWGTPQVEDEKLARARNIDAALAALASIGIPGLVAADFSKLMSEDDMTPALEIMAEVRAYFQVAYKRFSDNVPKQIDTDFIRQIDDGLDIALMSLDLSKEQCLKWLMEPAEIIQRRKELTGKKRRLGAAMDKLASYYDEQDVVV